MNFRYQPFLLTALLTIACTSLFAKGIGHRLVGQIDHYSGNTAYLVMIYGGHQYAVDTAEVTDGKVIFESPYKLKSGAYVVMLPPSNSFMMLIDEEDLDFSFKGDFNDLNNTLTFEGSDDNAAYYEYLRFFQSKKQYIDELKSQYDKEIREEDRMTLLSKMQQLKQDIIKYQTDLVNRLPGTLTAAMVKCELLPETPVFDGSPEESNLKRYMHQRNHFFDNVDLADERLIRAPKNILVDRVDYYLDNLVPQHPDSIIKAVDFVLTNSEQGPESYRFFVTHIFNKYREAKSIGMDAVYVHLAENYIATGKTPWIDQAEKEAVLNAVKMVSPTLIGKTAPDFTVQLASGQDISLHSIQSPYTILVFWAPNCTHCQQSIPVIDKFYNTYKSKGVQLFGVCTRLNEKEKSCWDFVEKNQLQHWIQATDKTGQSGIHSQYNLTTTPRIFVLDKNKRILAKDLGAEHLEEVMKRIAQ